MKNPAPYRYDIVGSFLRTHAIHEARSKFEAGEISAEELAKIEDTEIRGLVQKEENVGLKAVTDGEYRRAFWHMDFLWGLTGTQKVKAAHFSVAFKGFQPKAETVKIVDKLDFPEDHPFLKHYRFLQDVAADVAQPKQCIPSPSMLHLICCVREPNYQPIERYKDEQVLLDDLAAAYQKAVKAFYAAGCRYLQLDDTSWGEFCSAEKRKAYAERGIDVDEVGRKYVYVLNKVLEAKPTDMTITMHICRGNFRSPGPPPAAMSRWRRSYSVTAMWTASSWSTTVTAPAVLSRCAISASRRWSWAWSPPRTPSWKTRRTSSPASMKRPSMCPWTNWP